jgi:hypothetical protein
MLWHSATKGSCLTEGNGRAERFDEGVANKCRRDSKLSGLVDLLLSYPLVTVSPGFKLLKMTPKAVDFMLLQLGEALPRELTGRRRYLASGIVWRGEPLNKLRCSDFMLRFLAISFNKDGV